MFEAEYLAALRIDPGHHVLDSAIFSRRIHRLKDQQDGIAVGRVEKLLLRAQLRNMLSQKFLIMLFRLVHRLHVRRPLPEADLVFFPHTKIFRADFHFLPPMLAVTQTSSLSMQARLLPVGGAGSAFSSIRTAE